MSQIKSKNTTPELIVRKHLFKHGFRYRLHVRTLAGKPDIVLPKHNTIIFIHGCFWHSHEDCKYSNTPKTNLEYWLPKIKGNCERDKKATELLKSLGWHVIVIWECQLKKKVKDATLGEIIKALLHPVHNLQREN